MTTVHGRPLLDLNSFIYCTLIRFLFIPTAHYKNEEMIIIPNIKPISDLRNYTEVLKQVRMN